MRQIRQPRAIIRSRPCVTALESRVTPTGPVPVGPEFQVNSYTTGWQESPGIAMDAAGNFLVVWDSPSGGPSGGMVGQRYSSDGVPQGGEFGLLPYTGHDIAMDAAGNFVIAGPNAGGIRIQRFSAAGVAQGTEITVPLTYTYAGWGFNVAMGPSGDFVVVNSDDDGSIYGIFAQRFGADGVPIGASIPVNTSTSGYQIYPSVAVGANGDFVVTWDGEGPARGVFARRFAANGTPQGDQFNVVSNDLGGYSSIDVDAAGNFVVTWRSESETSPGVFTDYVAAQCYTATGVPLGGPIAVTQPSRLHVSKIGVAVASDGRFLVTWRKALQPDNPTNYDVYGRWYSASGTAVESEFPLSTVGGTSVYRRSPCAVVDVGGGFVAAWSDWDYANNSYDIRAQRFVQNEPPRVHSSRVNDGSAQRSRVTSLTVTFSQPVSFPNGVGNVFQLVRTGPTGTVGAVNLSAIQSGNVVTLTFLPGGAVGLDTGGALADGVYRLTAVAANILGPTGYALDGNGDGTPGDDYTFSVHRLFGDADGDGDVDITDFAALRMSFGGTANVFDFDNDGDVDTGDFGQFRTRFGTVLP